MYTSEKLANLLSMLDSVPASASEAARRSILDTVSAAVAGLVTPGGKAGREAAIDIWGQGPVPIWLTSARTSVTGAAFANSVAASILDLDDGHRAAAGHPGASIIPAVLAAVHENPALEARAPAAIAIGYEVGIRIAASRDLRRLDTVNSGRWCGQAVAAAVGWLKGLPPRVLAEAISIAGMVAPQMPVAEFTQVGNHVKEAIPHATANGFMSLSLAERGFAGPLDIFDDPRHFSAEALLSGFGESWLIETAYFKPYSCCRWIHAPIDGLVKIMADQKLSFQDISRIRVETFGKGVHTLNNQKAPKTLEAAQFSTPFCLGVTASRGPEALLPMTDPGLLKDHAALLIASLVEVVLDKEMDSYFSAAVPARISVSCGDTVFTETVMAPLGEPTNPMDWDMLFQKFHRLAYHQMRPGAMVDMQNALEQMRAGHLAPLLAELGHFQENCSAVFRPEMRKTKNL